jgi:microcystin-dependent protein
MVGLALLGALSAPVVMAGDDQFLGEITCGAWNFAPHGTLLAQGQLLPIAQNTALFSLLGTTYGGNGVNNFALPDLRGRTMVNAGQGVGLSPMELGASGGVEAQSLSMAQLPAHAHLVAPLGSSLDASLQSPAGNVPASKVRTQFFAGATGGAAMAAAQTGPTGQGAPVNNMQPYVTTNCVIAIVGIFPSRP